MTPDRCEGCVPGLALGDALGAPHEGGPVERLLWRLIGSTRDGAMRWTDDTQMSLDLAESMIDKARLDADDVARRFAAGYRWSRGYGPGTAKVLAKIRRGTPWPEACRAGFPGGSYGNGGAMRSPVIGLFNLQRPERAARHVVGRATHTRGSGSGTILRSMRRTRAFSRWGERTARHEHCCSAVLYTEVRAIERR